MARSSKRNVKVEVCSEEENVHRENQVADGQQLDEFFFIFNVLQVVRLSTAFFWDKTPLHWVIGAEFPNEHDTLIFQRSRGRIVLALDRVVWKPRDPASRPRTPES